MSSPKILYVNMYVFWVWKDKKSLFVCREEIENIEIHFWHVENVIAESTASALDRAWFEMFWYAFELKCFRK